MPSERRVLTIFIGSPGDLQEERKKAREVVERISNSIARRINWYVELRGWEDTLPGYSRPQERINTDVENCALFLGLMYKRWGSPTGKYTSGFEEELEIARERRKNTSEPEIWLYFKRIPEELLQDPGEQLKKVLEFKRKVQERRDLFYKEFTDVDEWEKLFYDNLAEYVVDCNEREREATSMPEPIMPHSISSTQTAGSGLAIAIEKVPQEVSNAIQTLFSALSDPEQFHTIDDYYRGRFFLMASSFLYASNHVFETIGTHEIQFLYAYRKQMELLPIEGWLILRTIISDEYGVRAGWYWLKETLEDEIVVDTLVYLATRDPNKYVRHGALLYIQRVWTDDIVEDIEAALKDSSSKVRQAALKLFEQHGTTENLKCIEPLFDDDQVDVRKSARAATLAILSKCDAHEAISFFRQSPRDERRDFDDYLKTVVSKAYPAELRLLLNDSDEAVRHIAFREMVSKGELQEHELWQFTKDPYHKIRYDAYLGLLKRGIELDSERVAKETELSDIFLLRRFGDERDRLLLEVYKTYSVDKLQSQIDWNSITGVLAYEALGLRHFEDFGEQIRQDLKTNFERIKQETIAKYRAQFGLTADIHLEQLEKYDSFIRENFTAAGLRVLAACGDKEDVTIAQTYITTSDSKIQEPAVEIVARHGNQDDSLILFDIAKNSYFDMKRIAATGALRLDKNNEMKIIEKFLQSKDAMFVGMAIKRCLDNVIQLNLDEVKALLYADNTEIRTYALAYLTNVLSEDELEKLLSEYSSAGRYYYNVITWLDRWLYAPKKLRESFREELKTRISSIA